MIPTEVATIVEMLVLGHDINSKEAGRIAWDIYNEFKDRLLPEGVSINDNFV